LGAFAWGREANPAAGRLWHSANQVALFLLFFLLAAGLVSVWRGKLGERALWPLAVGLVLLDLWTFGAGSLRVSDVVPSAYWRIVAQAVDDRAQARVLPWGLNEFDQNGGMDFGVRSVFAYDPLILQRFERFVVSEVDPLAPTYDLLNAGYLVTTAPWEAGGEPLELVHQEAGVYVYERPGALPRAWVVQELETLEEEAMLRRLHEDGFDPRAVGLVAPGVTCAARSADEPRVEIVGESANRIEARVTGGGGLLVFSEVAYPGWRAGLDGAPAPLVQADYLLRAVCVPAGDHSVVLTYRPPLLTAGLATTGVTLLALLVLALAGVRQVNGGHALG
jgi:hypothetical protein